MSLRGRAAVAVEVILALVIAFGVGRFTVHHASTQKPGAVDIGFAQDMSAHHQQAVLMANLAPLHAGPAVAALADSILVSQSQELGVMSGWLQLWHDPATSKAPMSWMRGAAVTSSDAGMSMTTMPGMASQVELDRLATLSGTAFDVLFLQLMIRHHQGGIEMAQYAQAHARLSVVRNAAQAMAFAQIDDISQMQALLSADGGTPLPPP